MDCPDNMCASNNDGSVRVSWDMQTGCEARIRNFPPLGIDMPVQHGGGGKHPCPHELLLAAVGSCFLGTFLVFQRQLRLRLLDLQISVKGGMEQAKRGKNVGKYDLTNIDVRVQVTVEGDADEKDIASDCIRMTRDHCPTTRALQASVPLNIVSDIRTVSEQMQQQ